MYVACSTLCFGKLALGDALRSIAELGFAKADVAFCEAGPHLKPSEVADDPSRAAQQLKIGCGLTFAAFHVELGAGLTPDEHQRQLRAVSRLGRVLATPVISEPAAPSGTDFAAEVERLKLRQQWVESEGLVYTVVTRNGTITEQPSVAAELCRAVPGLGITLDPSHYVAGPYRGQPLDELFPFVRHVRLRDSGKSPEQFQVRVGQGEIEYGRIVAQLERHHYQRFLAVDIRDLPEPAYPLQPEVRKLKYLLESLI